MKHKVSSVSAISEESNHDDNYSTTKEAFETSKIEEYDTPKINILRQKSPDLVLNPKSDKDIFFADFDLHLMEPIAKGKMSIIYKGVNLGNGRAIAVKFSKNFTLT